MKVTTDFGTDSTWRLDQAVLFYRTGGSDVAATTHRVELINNVPTIQPGTPVTLEAVEALALSLGRNLSSGLLPERVLSVSMKHLVWWSPAQVRRIWFKPALAKDREAEAAALRKLNGKRVLHPPLLFVAKNRDLRVLALARSQRPDTKTRLYVAPYFNLSPEGHMCNGSARLPQTLNPSAITQYENAFYDSAFSHSNSGHKLTRHPGGHTGYWQARRVDGSKLIVDRPKAPSINHQPSTIHSLSQLIQSLNKTT